MEVKTILLVCHAVFGTASLISGLIAAFSDKFGKVHKISGQIYFWSMTGIFVTGLPLAIMRANVFLMCISFFTFYITLTGFRYTRIRNSKKRKITDVIINQAGLLLSLFMLAYG